ncbi:MAG: diguanylate cyclase [Lachnospiraceae bacterium]|nr:diguanylate cyclase [Lachnospiraceae bacterium]
MKFNKLNVKRSILFVLLGILISVVLFTAFSWIVSDVSAKMTYEAALSVKKNMLYEYVNNFMIYLDGEIDQYLAAHPDADKAELEEAMLEIARKRIYEEEHFDGAYMWIQKVLDYNGGDDYAIRLVHPNLSDTEGCYLSTNEVNQMGMKAYETELQGIVEDGEIYQNYAFKKLDSDEVTEKVTYAKLYEPFDWIICMGVNLDDVDHYKITAHDNVVKYQVITLGLVVFAWMILLFLFLIVYRRIGIREYEQKNRELKDKLNWDALTGANSRLYGDRLLEREYNEFKEGKKDTLILMMDIDYFKQFNDGYGHELGDKVLKEFVSAVHKCTRSTDKIIRWGGDEFIVILQNVSMELLPAIGDKILESIRSIKLEALPGDVKITSSMGFSFFSEEDEAYKDTLARADEALYRAKDAGRNNWKV